MTERGSVPEAARGQLRRVLGPLDGTFLVAGNMIGAGIFVTPGLVAAQLPGAAWSLGAWLLGGLLSLAGAAVYSELGVRLPRAGGDYQYLKAALGPLPAFLTGWGAFLLTFSAAAAAMAIAVVDHVGAVVPALATLPGGAKAGIAAGIVMGLTWANVAGARVSGNITTAFTLIPVLGLMALYGGGLMLSGIDLQAPTQPFALPQGSLLVALGAAMLPIFFTYSGWNVTAYLAGELRDPARSLPFSLLAGTGAVTLLYLVVNLIFILVLGSGELALTSVAGAGVARSLAGPWGERCLAGLIALAILGSANVTLMAGARIYYAMAADALAPRVLRPVNAAGVPANALWAGGLWAALLAATGTFGHLLSWASLAILLLSALTVIALVILRRRQPVTRGFACPFYPLTPMLYLVTVLGVAAASLIADPVTSLIGLGLLAAGIPAYFLQRAWEGFSPASHQIGDREA